MAVVLSLTAALNAVALGYAFAEDNTDDLLVASSQLVFSLYTLVLAANSVMQDDANSHSNSIMHLTSLSTVASFLLVSVAILPSTPAPVIKVLAPLGQALQGLWYAVVALYTIVCVTAFTTPTGPPLFHNPKHIYSEKTVRSITNPDPENVCGLIGKSFICIISTALDLISTHIPGASPWHILMFSYTTKVVWLGNLASSLEIGDLPIVPANMRASLNYSLMRQALRGARLKIYSWSSQPGSGWGLIYKLLRLNMFALTMEILLAVSSAGLFYAPAFFLRLLISYLEVDPNRENKGWGWVYVLGLFAANAIGFLSKF